MDKLHAFYTGKAWRDLINIIKIQRGPRCERCRKHVLDSTYLLGHHKIELTEENVDDPHISLNTEFIELICLDCHNKEHRRFGYKKQVYLVWGSPHSGKHDAVRKLMKHGDIVLDIDALWKAVAGTGKPNGCRFNVFKLRDCLYDQIKTRYGQWCDAYVIGTYANKYERERIANELGAELIACESTREECMSKAIKAGDTTEWVTKWWDEYERLEKQ